MGSERSEESLRVDSSNMSPPGASSRPRSQLRSLKRRDEFDLGEHVEIKESGWFEEGSGEEGLGYKDN